MTNKAESHRRDAKRLLTHYFRLLARRSGGSWDNDNDAEVEQIVDLIMDGAIAAASEEDGATTHSRGETARRHRLTQTVPAWGDLGGRSEGAKGRNQMGDIGKVVVTNKHGAHVFAKPDLTSRWVWTFDYGTELKTKGTAYGFVRIPMSGWVRADDVAEIGEANDE